MADLLKPSLNWLLLFVPYAIYLEFFSPESHTIIFVASCISIIPLAGWMGHATEHIAEKTGEGVGGLLNATFGNAAELIIAIMALRAGLIDVVKASLTGSIIGNILLVMGLAFFAGGMKHPRLAFNKTGAQSQASSLLLAAIALVVPAVYSAVTIAAGKVPEKTLSLEISLILLLTYVAALVFSLITHKQLFSATATEGDPSTVHDHGHASWSLGKSIGVLLISTVFVAWMSEILVGSVEHAARSFGMTSVFVGVIVVAIVGNAAEHSTAIFVALKNRMDLSVGIAIGSSIQIALFVAPVLVLLSYVISPQPMDLVFTPAEVVAIALAVLISCQIANDGQTNWFEGIQLLSVYAILAVMFYFLPEMGMPSPAGSGH